MQVIVQPHVAPYGMCISERMIGKELGASMLTVQRGQNADMSKHLTQPGIGSSARWLHSHEDGIQRGMHGSQKTVRQLSPGMCCPCRCRTSQLSDGCIYASDMLLAAV